MSYFLLFLFSFHRKFSFPSKLNLDLCIMVAKINSLVLVLQMFSIKTKTKLDYFVSIKDEKKEEIWCYRMDMTKRSECWIRKKSVQHKNNEDYIKCEKKEATHYTYIYYTSIWNIEKKLYSFRLVAFSDWVI